MTHAAMLQVQAHVAAFCAKFAAQAVGQAQAHVVAFQAFGATHDGSGVAQETQAAAGFEAGL